MSSGAGLLIFTRSKPDNVVSLSSFKEGKPIEDVCHPLRIYVAGPYTNDDRTQVRANVQRAVTIGAQLIRLGHRPFVPHLSFYLEEELILMDANLSYEEWIDMLVWHIYSSDALFYIGESPGAARELEIATNLGMQVFHSISEVPVCNRE